MHCRIVPPDILFAGRSAKQARYSRFHMPLDSETPKRAPLSADLSERVDL